MSPAQPPPDNARDPGVHGPGRLVDLRAPGIEVGPAAYPPTDSLVLDEVARHPGREFLINAATVVSVLESGLSALDVRAPSVMPGGVNHDRNGSEILSRDQCLELLDQSLVGRVVFTERALPVALPVNFALLGEDVVFRTATGSKLATALAKAAVAFEVDDIDSVLRTGWSVLVQGWATLLTRPEDLACATALPLQPWALGDRWHFVRIRSESSPGAGSSLALAYRPIVRRRVGGRSAPAPNEMERDFEVRPREE